MKIITGMLWVFLYPKIGKKEKKMEVVMKLKGKVAVITGAGAGYGMSRGFPTIYAQEGADLVLNYYGDAQEKMDAFKKELESYGSRVILQEGDISKPEVAENKEAGIKILIPNGEFYASKVCDTFEEAIDLDVEALVKQLVKYKEKQRSK